MAEVGEAAVGGEHVAGRRLDHLVVVARPPRRLCEDGIAERHQAADHPDALALEVLDGLREVVVAGDGADLAGLVELGVIADDPRLVLEVELHGVDQAAVDEVFDAGALGVVGPGRRAHVHGARCLGVVDRHHDGLHGAVAGFVDRLEQERAGGRGVEVDGERTVVVVDGLAIESKLHVLLDAALDGDRLVDRHRREAGRHLELRGDAVDDVAPRERGVAQEHAAHRQLDLMLTFRERLLHELVLHERGGLDAERAPILLRLDVLEDAHTVDLEVGPVELVGALQGDADVELFGVLRHERLTVVDARAALDVDVGGAPEGGEDPDGDRDGADDEEDQEEVDLPTRPVEATRRPGALQPEATRGHVERRRARRRPQGPIGLASLAGGGWPRGCRGERSPSAQAGNGHRTVCPPGRPPGQHTSLGALGRGTLGPWPLTRS